jgi:hypothetical protein
MDCTEGSAPRKNYVQCRAMPIFVNVAFSLLGTKSTQGSAGENGKPIPNWLKTPDSNFGTPPRIITFKVVQSQFWEDEVRHTSAQAGFQKMKIAIAQPLKNTGRNACATRAERGVSNRG